MIIQGKKNIIVEMSFQFALNIIEFCELLEEKKKYIIAKQLIRSGTSVGANIREAQNAESNADFIHKMKISAKEADESVYWLELCKAAKSYPTNENLIDQANKILLVLSKIIGTAKRNK